MSPLLFELVIGNIAPFTPDEGIFFLHIQALSLTAPSKGISAFPSSVCLRPFY
ncbi:hypothetical protein HMPREF1869_00748 [Bacteroidales bacterium KA00251]|nr:hypothetical protein HMPREF1869_00748 [Bacteroidales bacterium KA00251]